MTKFNQFIKANKDYIEYQYWKDDMTLVRYAYNNTGKGIEQVYKLVNEYEIDKSDEIIKDLYRYTEQGDT